MLEDEVLLLKEGGFVVTSLSRCLGSRNELYCGTVNVAECINGDFTTRYGTIACWLRKIQKRSLDRRIVIKNTIKSLQEEDNALETLLTKIEEHNKEYK